MKRRLHDFARDERGQTMALMAVMVAGVVAMMALSIDLGMLYTAHSEAQRAAEAAALAGAKEFMNQARPVAASVTPARDSAMYYARSNRVRNIPIDSSEVSIAVDPNLRKVSVRIDRRNIPLWFAKLIGRSTADVAAHAAARAAQAGSAECVLPFAVPDMWAETPGANGGDDTDGNRIWDSGEIWSFGDDAADNYSPFASGVVPETGYGSTWRNGYPVGSNVVNDYGRPMILKVQDPTAAPTSGFFYPFQVDPTAGGGANAYRASIAGCDPTPVVLNTPIPLEMGNMKGPTRQGIEDLIALDPSAYWDNGTNSLVSQYGMASPRVRTIPLYDPNYILAVGGGNHTLTFNNFGLLFIEGIQTTGQGSTAEEWVMGRFLYFSLGAGGAGPGGATGSLVLILQLVE